MAVGLFQLRCAHCQHVDQLDLGTAVERLRSLGYLRRGTPDADMVVALSVTLVGKLGCQACGSLGVQLTAMGAHRDAESEATDWPQEVRHCRTCRQQISPERLEVFPRSELCAACQRHDELTPVTEFCPRCGHYLRIVKANSEGLTRYQERCDECGYRA
ncbi:MAG: hypothetical protein O3C60_15875 [Planctomycetota bacterium]|nr:hypothetical protein [Planctomycetota bacterium]